MASIFDGKSAIAVWFSVWSLYNNNNKISNFSAWLIPFSGKRSGLDNFSDLCA